MFRDPKDRASTEHAFASLGYKTLEKRYGVSCHNVLDRPFVPVECGDSETLSMNSDILDCDYLVNLPCLKTHNQTVVSLGIKNLKGTLDVLSRKKCHQTTPGRDLNFMVSRLAHKMPPIFTLIDGIFSLERGPGFDGKMHRTNLLIGSADVLAADLVGARVLGHDPAQVPHLALAAARQNRGVDLADIPVKGESIQEVTRFHEHDVAYHSDENGEMPTALAKDGIKGLFYRKFDNSLCTYCSGFNGLMLAAIRRAWKGNPWDRVEIINGKSQHPSPGMHKTILLGQCMCKAHKDNPLITEMIPIKGCPPDPVQAVNALHQAGIEVDPELFHKADELPGFFLKRYQHKEEFDESFFNIF